ncbi:MAG: glycerophosphodiester phosphodiesterase [Candidatus Brocadiae bacterium]|nr:glycerophosphodiester phosphodiesterase [Candidatus Brocadiia bacterium]
MRLAGHRGAPAWSPENTLASFAKALELGAQALEFDVHLTADGRLAVIHDATLDRTTNGVGRVADVTLEDIQRLRTDGGERVPSMDQVLDLAAGKAFLHVEVKDPSALRPAVDLLRARRLLDSARISSFWHGALRESKAVEPGLQTGVLFSAAPIRPAALALDAGADALHVCHTYITESLVAEARSHGLQVLGWTAQSAADVGRLFHLGVDEIVTDDPGMARQVLAHLAAPAAPPRPRSPEELRMDAERASIQALMKSRPGDAGTPREPGKKPSW